MIMDTQGFPLASTRMATTETDATTATTRAAREAPGAGCGLLISRVARISGYRLSRLLTAIEIRGHEFAILHRLAEGGPANQQELSRVLRVHPSNLVALIDQLEDAKLVARRRDPEDRRRHRIELRAAGVRRLEQAMRAAAEAERELLSPLSDSERVQLRSYLERLAEHGCRAPQRRGC